MRAQFVLQEVWTGLRRNLTMTVALVVVVAISLSLLGTGLLFVKQVNQTRTYWQGRVQLSIYMCTATSPSPQCRANGPATAAEKQQIKNDLTALKSQGVESIQYESQAQAFQHFKQEFSQDKSFARLVSPGEIPDSYQVKLRNVQSDFGVVAGTVQGRPGVDNIVNAQSILANFYKLLDGARNAVIAVAIILVIAAILLVANTIRLSAFNRRRETSIMRLVGASNFYVQLPFLVEGVIAGMFGWLIASALLIAVKTLGLDTLQQYFPYNVQLSLADLIEVIVLAMVMAVLLCGATSFLTLRRYLRA
ncbi:MAG: cell division transport system permease protein [Streptosporangiaceae bacterium]|jgi:cell division transport system permease protein|nr:cell division transport system permease protein [Streptosporangiaceae bacterium]